MAAINQTFVIMLFSMLNSTEIAINDFWPCLGSLGLNRGFFYHY